MAFEPKPEIYTDFISSIELTDFHARELQEKRGFTEDIVRDLRFRSGGAFAKDIIEELKKRHNIGDLYLCGLIDHLGNAAWQVSNPDFIIIPYLNSSKDVYFIKSHKFGNLRESGVYPYSDYTFDAIQSDTVVLCESEFKAAAMYSLGFKALGLGGVASFTGHRINQLERVLSDDKIKKVIILFDTEIQDNPEFTNYKNDFRKRYAQHVYAFILARRLEILFDQKKKVTIGALPKAWMVDGKADIDGCVAQGKTKQDFEVVLQASISPAAYLDFMDVKDEHKPWVNRKIKSVLDEDIVFENDSCYWVQQFKLDKDGNSTPKPVQVSNFTIKVNSILEYNDDVMREIQLVSKFGDRSRPFHVTASQLSNYQEFKEACLNRGDFLWKGTGPQFNLVSEHLFLETDIVPTRMREMIGRDEDYNQWLFGNVILKDDGREIEVEKDGLTFRSPDEGYRLGKLNNLPLPILHRTPIDKEEIFEAFQGAWGINGIKALAYTVSTLFSNVVFDKYQMFPFLLIYGEKKAGKSTLSDALVFPIGFPVNHASMNLNDTTIVAVNRNLAYYHSLPCRFDEYRSDEKKINDKQSILRSIYNRQSSSKGIRASFGTREVEPKGTFVLIGEEKPSDPALLSRCIPIYLTPNTQTSKSYECIRWIYENSSKLSYITYELLKDYKKNAAKFLSDMEATRAGLRQVANVITDFRTQQHYAMLMAALGMFFPAHRIAPVMQAFQRSFVETVTMVDHDSAINRFFGDINSMRLMGEDVSKYVAKEMKEPDHVAIYFQGLYHSWTKFKSQRSGLRDVFNENTLKEYLKSQPYFVTNNARRSMKNMGEDKRVNCIIIDAASPFLPISLKEMILDNTQVSIELHDSTKRNN